MSIRIVKLGIVSSIYGHLGRIQGGDACMHNLPLTGFYKREFLTCVLVRTLNLACAYAHFYDNLRKVLYNSPSIIDLIVSGQTKQNIVYTWW